MTQGQSWPQSDTGWVSAEQQSMLSAIIGMPSITAEGTSDISERGMTQSAAVEPMAGTASKPKMARIAKHRTMKVGTVTPRA